MLLQEAVVAKAYFTCVKPRWAQVAAVALVITARPKVESEAHRLRAFVTLALRVLCFFEPLGPWILAPPDFMPNSRQQVDITT